MADFTAARPAARAAGLDATPGQQMPLSGHAASAERASAALAGDLTVHAGMRRLAPNDAADRLPALARSKLLALRAVRDDALAMFRAASDQRDQLRGDRLHWEARLRHLQTPQWSGPGAGRDGRIAPDQPSMRQAQEHVDRLTAEFTRLSELSEARAAAWQERARLVEQLERYIAGLGDVEIEAFAGDVEPPKFRGSVVDAVEARRRRVRELDADRHTAESAPMPSAWCKARAKAQIAQLAQRGPDVLGLVETGSPITWPTRTVTSPVRTFSAGGDGGGVVQVEAVDTAGLIAWLDPEQLYQRVAAEIDAMSDDKAALSDDARAARLAEIAADRLATEREEEALITLAEAQSTAIARRTGADPRAVLQIVGPAPRAES